jgi:hypothetical protein
MTKKVVLLNIPDVHRGMIRRQIYLPETLHADLKRVAEQQGISFAKVVRRTVELYLKEKAYEN